MKKILVTGSAGMLGADLVRVLNPAFEVYGMSRHDKSRFDQPDRTIHIDLTDTALLRNEILRIKPDVVIHTAAFTKVDLCEDPKWKDVAKVQNTSVVESLIDICNETGAFLVFFSTDYVFSGLKKEPYLENDSIEPINFYGQTKAWAEEALKQKSKRFMIFRVTWLFGKNGNHFPKAILKQAAEKNEIAVVSDQWGRPTWTRDLAVTLLELLTSRQNLFDQYNMQVFHIGNSGQTNWSDFARRVLDQTNHAAVHVKEISSAELKRAAKRPLNSVLNLDDAKKCLGIEMRPWQEALDEFLKGLD